MERLSKKLKEIIVLFVILSFVFGMTVSATEPIMITFRGYTTADNGDSVTLLMLKKGTDINNLNDEDIVYIAQSRVRSGRFSIDFPLYFDTENYVDIYSSADNWEIKETSEIPDTVYVSANGNNANNGETPETAVKSLDTALNMNANKIILVTDTEINNLNIYTNLPQLEGLNNDIKLTLPSSVTLQGDLKVDKLILSGVNEIVANGHFLEIGSSVTTSDLLTVYGGKENEALNGDTNITLLGGNYQKIFGGGKNGAVYGNTNVIVGGNVNLGKDIDDGNTDTLAPTIVYGGGFNGAVSGKANVTLKDNAVVYYIKGAGQGTLSNVSETDICIAGGKAMNVYGGSGGDGPALDNCNTKITMTGGAVEAIFGGSEGLSMTGNTTIELIGGTVYRRVYTGCYNNVSGGFFSSTWSSSHSVTGTTTLIIYPEVLLNQSSYLSEDNQADIGVYAGSRRESKNSAEINTVIFANDCYSTKKSCIGSQDFEGTWIGLKSYEDYVVDAGKNGVVCGTYTGGEVYVTSSGDYVGKVGDNYYKDENVAVTKSSVTQITFEPIIESSSANRTDTGVKVEADMNTSAWLGKPVYTLVALYEHIDGKARLVGISADNTLAEREFEIECTFESDKTYTIGIMIWNENMVPMIRKYTVIVPQ